MAKYSLNSHVRSDRAKWWIVGISLLIVGVILCGLITTWFQEWNPFCWFGHDYSEENVCIRCGAEKPIEEEQSGAEQANSNVIITPMVSEGISLFSEPMAVSDNPDTYTLTATLSPAQVEEIYVDWTVEFVDPESAWATGKTVIDYVTVTPTSDGALTATVECLQAFGSQIQVVVTVRDYEHLTATCTVDYKVRFTKIISQYTYGPSAKMVGYQDNGVSDIVIFDLKQAAAESLGAIVSKPTFRLQPSLSQGTISGAVTSFTYSVMVPQKTFNKIISYKYTYTSIDHVLENRATNTTPSVNNGLTFYIPMDVTLSPTPSISFQRDDGLSDGGAVYNYLGVMFPGILQKSEGLDYYYLNARKELLIRFAQFYADESIPADEKYTFMIKMEATYGGDTYVFERKVLVKYEMPVSSVSLDHSSIVF